MNAKTCKRIEEKLAWKAWDKPDLIWNTDNSRWTIYDEATEDWLLWSPLTNLHDAGSLFWRLVEKRDAGSAEVTFDPQDSQRVVRVIIKGERGYGVADTDSEALCLAMCKLKGISMEDDDED